MNMLKTIRPTAVRSLVLVLCGCTTLAQSSGEFTIAIPDFSSLPASQRGDVPYTMNGLKHAAGHAVGLKDGAYQRKQGVETTIRVPRSGTTVTLKLVPASGITYRIFGVAFQRADGTPTAIVASPTSVAEGESPFTELKITGHTVQLKIVPVSRRNLSNPPALASDNKYYTTYKYSIFIQDTKSGIVGTIDPEIETENPP